MSKRLALFESTIILECMCSQGGLFFMIKCPKCNETIGVNVKMCPVCRNEIPDEDRNRASRDNELLHEEAELKAIEEYHKRTYIGVLYLAIVMVIFMILAGFIEGEIVDSSWLPALGIVLLVVYVIGIFKFHIGMCPYCESFLGGSPLTREYCDKCGGRLS